MLASLGVWQMVSFTTTCVLEDTLSSDVPLLDWRHLGEAIVLKAVIPV